MKRSILKRLRQAKQRIERRLDGGRIDQGKPMFAASNIRVELADKIHGIGAGGIGVVQRLERRAEKPVGHFNLARGSVVKFHLKPIAAQCGNANDFRRVFPPQQWALLPPFCPITRVSASRESGRAVFGPPPSSVVPAALIA